MRKIANKNCIFYVEGTKTHGPCPVKKMREKVQSKNQRYIFYKEKTSRPVMTAD